MDNVKKYEERLGTAPLFSLMLKMALPSMAAQMVNLLYSIVDRVYIGHIASVGTDALAGVGVCSTLIILIAAFAQFIGGGGAPLASIALGQGDRTKAEKILNGGFTVLMIFSAALILIFAFSMTPLLRLIGASAATLPYAKTYFSLYLIGTPAVMVTLGLNSYINVQGRPMIAMLSVIIGAVINIVLDPLLIFALKMGVAGAALATVVSQYVSAVWILRFLLSEKATLRLLPGKRPDGSIPMKPELFIMKPVFALGISPFIMSVTESLVGFALNGSLSGYGDIYVSALTVMQSAMQFVSVPLQGFAQGCVPVLSYNYGHGEEKRVIRAFHILLAVEFLYGFVLNLLMMLFPAFTAGIFTQDPQLIETVSRVMPVFLIGMLIFGLQRACQNTFVALGQAKISIFIALLRKVILLIPLVFILQHFIGLMGIYAAEAAADGLAAITCSVIFACTFKKILRSRKEKA